MWDTTALNSKAFDSLSTLKVWICGIPHLAKNERDVGHPGSVAGKHNESVGWGFALLFRPMYAQANMGHPSREGAWFFAPAAVPTTN
jgi:hypothetical protein